MRDGVAPVRAHAGRDPPVVDSVRDPPGDGSGVRLDDVTVVTVADEFERLTGVGARQHGLAALEGFNRDEPVVLVLRYEWDEQSIGIELRQRGVIDVSQEADPPIAGSRSTQRLSSSPVPVMSSGTSRFTCL